MLSNRSVGEVIARRRRPLLDGRGSGPRVGAAGVAARGRGGEDRSLTVAARYRRVGGSENGAGREGGGPG